MSTLSNQVVPSPVLGLWRRLEQWRRSRPKLGPIPDVLWREAVQLARDHGICLVARALRLEYYALKRRLEATAGPREPVSRTTQAFVEISMPTGPAVPEYLVEMERPDGGKMRVRFADQGGVIALSESFWRCRP